MEREIGWGRTGVLTIQNTGKHIEVAGTGATPYKLTITSCDRIQLCEPALSTIKKKAKPRRSGFSKDKILVLATKMFAERGYAAISIRDIAGACGISIPSIYHFFGDKENLYLSCYEYTFSSAAEQLRVSLANKSSGRVRVKQFTVALCEVLMNDHDFRRLLQRELLREERRAIDQLTTHHFRAEFEDLTINIAKLSGEEGAMDRAFSIYALAFGLIQLKRIGELAGMSASIASSAVHLAEHVLTIVLPEHRWG